MSRLNEDRGEPRVKKVSAYIDQVPYAILTVSGTVAFFGIGSNVSTSVL